MVALLGINPRAAFPIMMGACAFLMPMAGMQFVRKKRYSLRACTGMAVGGIFGSALALLIVKELNLTAVMWLVTAVVIMPASRCCGDGGAREEDGNGAGHRPITFTTTRFFRCPSNSA